MFTPLKRYPPTYRSPLDYPRLSGTNIGLDLEWDRDMRITILGLADKDQAVSTGFAEGRPYLDRMIRKKNVMFVGHNVVRADKIALRDAGIHIPLERFHDTILLHWLNNSHLCKSKQKSTMDEDGDGKRGPGYMNLGTMLSLYTDLPHHKTCK